jgi:hypothetical protein
LWCNKGRRGWCPWRANANAMMMTASSLLSWVASVICGGVLLGLGDPLGRWGNRRRQGWDPHCADANMTMVRGSRDLKWGENMCIVVVSGKEGR